MAQPIPYERGFDFEAFQSGHPSTPLPADKMNAELDSVSAQMAEIVDRIAILQRDDLALANQIVGYDQLSAEVVIGFRPPTAWAPGVSYVDRSTVFQGNIFYVATRAHQSGVFADDLEAGFWEELADFTIVSADAAASAAAALASEIAAGASAASAFASEGITTSAAATAVSAANLAVTSKDEAAISADLAESARIAAQAAASDPNIVALGAITGAITTVAGISADIGTVAGIAADVTAVSGVAADVTTVAGIAAAVSTVAGISSSVVTAAANVVAIGDFNTYYTGLTATLAAKAPLASPTFTGTVTLPTTTNVGSILRTTAANLTITPNTADGSDTGFVLIRGGDATSNTRGASAIAYGNEHASNPGRLWLTCGSTGDIVLTATGRSVVAAGSAFTWNGVDIATQAYVDAATATAGLQLAPVAAATTANITLSGSQSIDGVTSGTSRILVKNQTLPRENGVYVSAAGAWTRATDSDSWVELTNKRVFVLGGSTQAGSSWASTIVAGGTLNTTDVTYAQSSTQSVYSGSGGVDVTGTVVSLSGSVLTTLGLNNVTNTSDANKPVSTAQQTALDLKADISSLGALATLSTVGTSTITDANVTNAKLANIATSSLKGRLTAGTGVVEDLTLSAVKTAMSLGSVNNTSDANKPVSTAQQTALNLKANLASPTLTGTPLAPTPTDTDDTTKIATTAHVKDAIEKHTLAPTLRYGADAAGGANDLTGLDNLIAAQASALPRLQRWAYGSIDVASLIPGSDSVSPMEYLRKIFEAGLPDGKAYVFGAQRAWNFGATRPGTYLTLPKKCILEWKREFDLTGWQYGFSPRIFSHFGTFGEAVTISGSLVKGTTRTINVAAGKGALFSRGQRVLLYATANLTNLIGAYTMQDNNVPDGADGTYAARSEAVYVQYVVGDLITISEPVKDNYPSTCAPKLAIYENEGDIHLINPTVRMELINPAVSGTKAMLWTGIWAPGLSYAVRMGVQVGASAYICLTSHTTAGDIDGTFAADLAAGRWRIVGSDTVFAFNGAKRVLVEGGEGVSPLGRFLVTSSIGSLVVRDHVGHLNDKGEGSPGGYFWTGGTTYGGLIQNCHTYGGGQPFMNCNTGSDRGVTRDLVYDACSANGSKNGFSQHNLEEFTTYRKCIVRGSTGAAFDIRTKGSKMLDCEAYDSSTAAYIRTVAQDIKIDGLTALNCAQGVLLTTFEGAHEYVPRDISITDCDIRGATSAGAITMLYGDVSTDPLGTLEISGNRLEVANTTPVVDISGRWTKAKVVNNDAIGTTGVGYRLKGGTGGATNGPIGAVVKDNTYVSGMIGWSIANTTGTVVNSGNVAV